MSRETQVVSGETQVVSGETQVVSGESPPVRGQSQPVRVLLVDDDPLVCSGLELMLSSAVDISVVGSVGDGDQVVGAVQRHHPDVVLMDVRMARVDGITATRELVGQPNPPRVIVLTTFAEDSAVMRAVEAGAHGFLLKTAGPSDIIDAVRRVAAGEGVLSPASVPELFQHVARHPVVTGRQETAGRLAKLTERERQIVIRVAQGLSNADVARALYVSEATVKSHLGAVLTRLGCTSRVEVAVLAERAGWLQESATGVR
ncbi:response regulator [Ornithinimicrobium cavernae]|uniref:response regulator n=1 Tax=Ornithinimicrobium cavernae TaxID=2666047 RepID=UPI001F3A71C8|nr:response regulator transcription factor [Ornithinimicrobium cavernae]